MIYHEDLVFIYDCSDDKTKKITMKKYIVANKKNFKN